VMISNTSKYLQKQNSIPAQSGINTLSVSHNGLLLERLIGGPGLPCGAPAIVTPAANSFSPRRATQ